MVVNAGVGWHDFDWDKDSINDINAGANKAKKEQAPKIDPLLEMMNSRVNHVYKAQSPKGCS